MQEVDDQVVELTKKIKSAEKLIKAHDISLTNIIQQLANHKANVKSIETSIKSKKFFINENIKLNTVKIDETYPDYIRKNQI